MDADAFLHHPGFGAPVRPIEEVVREWDGERKAPAGDDCYGLASMLAVLGIDAATGDELLNQISPELRNAFADLEGAKADTYDEVRTILADKIAKGDASVLGLVNKLKGQIGENRFVEAYDHAALVGSRSQEAVDAFIAGADGSMRYVQVKMYSDPDKVISAMREVHDKVVAGHIFVEGDLVQHVDFAIPADIAGAVKERLVHYPELSDMYILPVPTTAADAAAVVQDSVDHVAHPILNMGHDVLDGVIGVAALDALTNAYLVIKGKKSATQAGYDAVVNGTVSSIGIVTSKGVALGSVHNQSNPDMPYASAVG